MDSIGRGALRKKKKKTKQKRAGKDVLPRAGGWAWEWAWVSSAGVCGGEGLGQPQAVGQGARASPTIKAP